MDQTRPRFINSSTLVTGLFILSLSYVFYLLYRISWFDNISSIANDSVNYLVMARHYSPWVSESEAIKAVWPLQDFPPLFPMLLAVTGVAHSIYLSHVLVTVIGMLCLWAFYVLLRNVIISRFVVPLLVVVFAMTPGFILGLQGVLSESLYLLLTLIFLVVYGEGRVRRNKTIVLTLLLAAALLTRTIGLVLLIAVVMQTVLAGRSLNDFNPRVLIITIFSLLLSLAVYYLAGPDRDSHYSGVLERLPFYDIHGVSEYLLGQMGSLYDAWRATWIIYWLDEINLAKIVVNFLLLFSIAGCGLRLIKNKLDAWYVLGYLMVLTVWPHPGQMVRLLMPVIPLLILHAAYMLQVMFEKSELKDGAVKAQTVFSLIILVTVMPAHAFIHGRIDYSEVNHMVPVYEYFRFPDAKQARQVLYTQNQMLEDFSVIGEQVSKDDFIGYYAPEYLALLGNQANVVLLRDGRAMDAYRREAHELDLSYIMVTRIHPRKSRQGYDALHETYFNEWASRVWCSNSSIDYKPVTCLYLIDSHMP